MKNRQKLLEFNKYFVGDIHEFIKDCGFKATLCKDADFNKYHGFSGSPVIYVVSDPTIVVYTTIETGHEGIGFRNSIIIGKLIRDRVRRPSRLRGSLWVNEEKSAIKYVKSVDIPEYELKDPKFDVSNLLRETASHVKELYVEPFTGYSDTRHSR